MTQSTCSQDRCAAPVKARGVCNAHYLTMRRAGTLPAKEPQPEFHRLTNVDKDALTAECSRCGPTVIRLRGGRRGPECSTKRREHQRNREPDSKRRWKYGLTEDALAELVTASGGRCAICDCEFVDGFHIDHSHETGAVRGLLCARCNWGIGWLKDDPATILSAYFYLVGAGQSA